MPARERDVAVGHTIRKDPVGTRGNDLLTHSRKPNVRLWMRRRLLGPYENTAQRTASTAGIAFRPNELLLTSSR